MCDKLNELAREAVEQYTAIEDQYAHIDKAIKADDELRREVVGSLIHMAISRVVYSARYVNNRAAKSTAARDPAAAAAIERALSRSILDAFVLPNGKRLGDTTGNELLSYVSGEQERAKGHLKNAALFERLGHMAGDRIIREAVSGKKADAIWREIENGNGQLMNGSQRNVARPVRNKRRAKAAA